MSDRPKMTDAEFTLITICLLLGFFGTLGFGGGFFLAVFIGIVGMLFGAHLVSTNRKINR